MTPLILTQPILRCLIANLVKFTRPFAPVSFVVLAMLSQAGCVLAPTTNTVPAPTLNTLPSANREQVRISDGAIMADTRFLADLQRRMAALNAGGVPAKNYHLSKAGAWLEFATEEYSDNDRSGVIEAALEQSLRLIRALETKASTMPEDTPIIKASRRIRDDLWLRAEKFKQHAQFDCVADRVALLEVQLVWAGHEDLEGGWRHAKPYIEIAEDMADRIDTSFAMCAMSTVAKTTADKASETSATVTTPATAPVPPAPTTFISPTASVAMPAPIVLSTDTMFRFNGSSVVDIQTSGRRELDAMVDKIKSMGAVQRILITGHTDRLGNSAYNLRLSLARANSIRQVLLERGFAPELVQAAGAGESEPLVTCTGDRASPSLVNCLQANRRVEIRVLVKPAAGAGR